MKTEKPKSKSRHGKNSPDTIKLTFKTDFNDWRRVNKAAEKEGIDVAAFLRREVHDLVWDIPLDDADYEIIKHKKAERIAKGV